MASTNRRPAIAIMLPTAEAAPVVAELRTGGFEPILVSDLAELAALVAVRRDVAVAVLDVEGEADGGASTWAVLHEFGRNIPALLVVNPSTLDPTQPSRSAGASRRCASDPWPWTTAAGLSSRATSRPATGRSAAS
jgi:hypothetical protein